MTDALIRGVTAEAPWEYVAPFAKQYPTDQKRQIFYGMLAFVDAAVKNVTDALKETGDHPAIPDPRRTVPSLAALTPALSHDGAGMWENTLYVWTNDNVRSGPCTPLRCRCCAPCVPPAPVFLTNCGPACRARR